MSLLQLVCGSLKWGPLMQCRRLLGREEVATTTAKILSVPSRPYRARHVKTTYLQINKRLDMIKLDERLRQGHETIPRRADFIDWNYDAELYAFCARVGENFSPHLLRQSLLDPSYAAAERQRQRELGVEEGLGVSDNSELAERGQRATRTALEEYLRPAFPYLPEEGVQALVAFLTSEEVLADVSFHIGTKDLIKTQEYPPSKSTHRRTFYALVGALQLSEQGEGDTAPQDGWSRWRRFIVDLVAARLHGQDLTDVWDVSDPMGTLAAVLARAGRGEPESRLLWESGRDSLLGCAHVGVYSDKEIIGQAPGETAEIAEEMAARDALRRLFRISDSSRPLPMGDKELGEFAPDPEPNVGLDKWTEGAARAKNLVRLSAESACE